ncbi:head GIN domain-containing protein [Flammeovirga sp. OC4]|uniref:head GIN domain-containing protein n=1 Tax=Flammeovirga sp. OC4 TaxID=1382345 RepID=UPI0005C6E45A|nr:head GIN domain-containing protein [Flammeovirga sp. OC4]
MRNLINFILFAFLIGFTTSCTEKGEGPIISDELAIDYFTGIEVNIAGQVLVEHGTEQKVYVESQQNVLNALSREVVNGVWKIKLNTNISNYDFKLHIITPEVDKTDVSGSANVEVLEPYSESGIFRTAVSGSGSLNVSGMNDVNNQIISAVSGSGNVSLSDIETKDMNVSVSGSGNVELNGTTITFTAKTSGSGSISDFRLTASEVDAETSGSGSVSFTCTDKLYAKVSGSGNIQYKGNPTDVETVISGSGKIEKVD